MHLSLKLLSRLWAAYEMGVSKETVELAQKTLESLSAKDSKWAVFAHLEADPPHIELHDETTGAYLEICILR